MDKKKDRIYICHTFYHVYVACLKELNLPEEEGAGGDFGKAVPRERNSSEAENIRGKSGKSISGGKDSAESADGVFTAEGQRAKRTTDEPGRFTAGMPAGAVRGGATLVLSRMSNDFGDLDIRARACGLFEEVVWFDEKPFQYFEELKPLKKDTGSLAGNMRNRMKFCRRYGQLEEPFVPVDLAQYRDIYVFCDSDPIGYYLSYKRIRYHAVEDGLNCIRYYDTARWDNRGHFALKARLAAMGLIFIQNGYGRYCIDMEVNDISALDHPTDKMVEVPREKLTAGLTAADRELLIRLFIANRGELEEALRSAKRTNRPAVLVLTEPLCADLAMRRKLFEDLIEQYGTFPAEGSMGPAWKPGNNGADVEGRAAQAQAAAGPAQEPRNDGVNFDDSMTSAASNPTGKPVDDRGTIGGCRDEIISESAPEPSNRGADMESRAAQAQAAAGPAQEPAGRRMGTIVIKPHPRDVLDYHEIFPQHIVLDAKFPMEILNFLDIGPGEGRENPHPYPAESAAPAEESASGAATPLAAADRHLNCEERFSGAATPTAAADRRLDCEERSSGAAASARDANPVFDRVVTVYTVPDSIHCAGEKIYLGNEWMDKYEDKSAHAHVTDHR